MTAALSASTRATHGPGPVSIDNKHSDSASLPTDGASPSSVPDPALAAALTGQLAEPPEPNTAALPSDASTEEIDTDGARGLSGRAKITLCIAVPLLLFWRYAYMQSAHEDYKREVRDKEKEVIRSGAQCMADPCSGLVGGGWHPDGRGGDFLLNSDTLDGWIGMCFFFKSPWVQPILRHPTVLRALTEAHKEETAACAVYNRKQAELAWKRTKQPPRAW
jgi:hypothetical protein